MQPESPPGTLSVRKLGEQTYVCTYDQDGCEYRYPLPKPDADNSTK